MTVERYFDRPRRRRVASYAARFEPGAPLDDLLAVAHKKHYQATMAEVPELKVLVVRYLRVPDDHPASVEYVVVEAGDLLVYSEWDLLYSSDPETFAAEHEPAPPSGRASSA